MPKQRIHNKTQLKTKRQELRKNLTPAEAFLWTHIKSRQLKGKRFTKQHSIKNYIVDFYCASEKLIIELDGEVHNNPVAQEYDNIRSSHLENLGYTVIRFENKLVFENLPSVLKEITSNFED
ncbi:endonuclease domain-containing protein [Hanstruepera flava]|uniref:endonuclease domain-containing protein n=1 Tax=Hanstruepera flava TaxID=2930218 RepID=UPI0020277A38|nr:endonuclease domain-containing protein [Hanstruepera flava]